MRAPSVRWSWVFVSAYVTLAAALETLAFLPQIQGIDTDLDIFEMLFPILLVAYPTMGALLARRHPSNPVGWLMLVSGVLWLITGVSDEYVTSVAFWPELPLAQWVGWLNTWIWLVALAGTGIFMLLFFPNGELPSRRWRIVFYGAVAGTLLGVIANATDVTPLAPGISNPTGVASPLLKVLGTIGFVLFILSFLSTAASLFVRLRSAVGEERQQIKWVAFFATLVAPALFIAPLESWVGAVGWFTALLTLLFAIPIAIGIAILKYRLYEIDVVINKTLVFGSLAAFITAVYVAIVVGLGTALGSADEPNLALSIAATAIVAIAFQPVKDRVQKVANRLVYGHRQTPYEVLSDFSAKVATSYETEEVTPAMAKTLKEATNAARADVWLAIDGSLVRAATFPPDSFTDSSIALNGVALPAIEGADHAVAVTHQQELLGALSVTKDKGDPLSAADHKLVDDLSSQAGIVLRNSRLTAELRARLEQISSQAQQIRSSRQRIVSAQDKERRRLERDIHDGAQQHLVALAVKLRLAKTMTERKPERAASMLEELRGEMQDAVETLDDLARGIYPPLLKDKGIASALTARVDKTPFEVSIEDHTSSRFDPAIEAATYFCCLEALQNTAKYADATKTTITLDDRQSELAFSITDDGLGFDSTITSPGSGLTGIADRLAALEGTIEVISAPGRGTSIIGLVPIESGGKE